MPNSPEKKEVIELSEEEVMSNDIDPLDAIAQIRRDEGVPEEDIIINDSDASSQEDLTDSEEDGKDELDNLDKGSDETPTPTEEELAAEAAAEAEAANKDPDADPDSDPDADTDDKDPDTKDDTDKAESLKFTANGQEFEFTQEEIMEQFGTVFGQAMDYTHKTQKMAPYRKMISALETENISADQLNMAIDALKGNKDAIKKLMETNKIDAYDLTKTEGEDEKSSYTPSEYGKNDTELAIQEVTSGISGDPEYQITVNVIDEQWDDNSRNALVSNPQLIKGLHNDIKSGVYDQVAPVAMKMKVLDGNTKSDIEYYMLAGEQVLEAQKQNSENSENTVAEQNKAAQDAENKFDQASSEAERKRAASSTRGRTDRKGVIDYLDDDDKDFDAWYKNLQANN